MRAGQLGVVGPGRGEHDVEAPGAVEHQIAVAEVIAHPSRGHPGAGQDLQSQVRRGAAGAGESVGAIAGDHGQPIRPVRVRPADEPERGTHGDEMGVVGIGVDRQFGAQCRDPVEQANTLEQFALVAGVGGDLGGQIAEDLPDETPGFQRLLATQVLRHVFGPRFCRVSGVDYGFWLKFGRGARG